MQYRKFGKLQWEVSALGFGAITKPPEQVAKVWQHSSQKRTPTEWALLWVWSHPEVSVVLSGMSAMGQVVENVAVADYSVPGMLTGDDLALIDQVREAWKELSPVPCTKCGYCMPCPNGVEIPRIFELYNNATMYDAPLMERVTYEILRGRADQCIDCGECVETCPQEIAIPEWLRKAHDLLSASQ